MDFIEHYLVAALVFTALDAVWLSLTVNRFYKKQIGVLLADKPNFVTAVIFYAIYMIGVVFFVVNPALDKNSLNYAILGGGLLGLTMYATYDLTNQSTLKKWSTKLTIVDMAWGTIVTGAVSAITYLIFA